MSRDGKGEELAFWAITHLLDEKKKDVTPIIQIIQTLRERDLLLDIIASREYYGRLCQEGKGDSPCPRCSMAIDIAAECQEALGEKGGSE